MENNHLSYFKIENFKKFDSLEVNDIGQFNLIVGENNVGKTCLLEALLLDFHAKRTLATLHYTFEKRNIKIGTNIEYLINKEDFNFNNNLIGLSQKDKNKSIIIQKKNSEGVISKFEIENLKNFNPLSREDTNEFIDKVDLFQYKGINQLSKNWLVFKSGLNNEITFITDITSSYYKDFYYYLDYVPIIRINDLYSDDLIEFYQEIVKNPNDEKQLIELVQKIFSNLEINRFSIFDYFNKMEYLHISTNKKPDYHPVNEYGDGLIKILRILFEILINGKKHLLIDEIETGIHHSRQKDFWVNIIKVCQELDVQLFATTHSKECANAYIEAAKSLDNNIKDEFRLIELYESKESIFSGTIMGVENIDYSIKNLPFRGENIYD